MLIKCRLPVWLVWETVRSLMCACLPFVLMFNVCCKFCYVHMMCWCCVGDKWKRFKFWWRKSWMLPLSMSVHVYRIKFYRFICILYFAYFRRHAIHSRVSWEQHLSAFELDERKTPFRSRMPCHCDHSYILILMCVMHYWDISVILWHGSLVASMSDLLPWGCSCSTYTLNKVMHTHAYVTVSFRTGERQWVTWLSLKRRFLYSFEPKLNLLRLTLVLNSALNWNQKRHLCALFKALLWRIMVTHDSSNSIKISSLHSAIRYDLCCGGNCAGNMNNWPFCWCLV